MFGAGHGYGNEDDDEDEDEEEEGEDEDEDEGEDEEGCRGRRTQCMPESSKVLSAGRAQSALVCS